MNDSGRFSDSPTLDSGLPIALEDNSGAHRLQGFPFHETGGITAAGPSPIFTVFPITSEPRIPEADIINPSITG